MDPHSEIEEIASLFSERLREAEERTLAARQVMLEAIHTRLDLPLSDPPLSDPPLSDPPLSDPPSSNAASLTDSTVARPSTAPVPVASGLTGTWRTPRDVDLRWAASPATEGQMTDDSPAQRRAPTDERVSAAQPARHLAETASQPAQPLSHPAVRSDHPSRVATPNRAALRSEERVETDRSDRAFLWAVPLAGLVALATVALLLLLL